jgi:two-component system LytT family sensor kinase
MTLQELIFSNVGVVRLSRHVIFWTVFSLGYFAQSIVPDANPVLTAFTSSCCFLPACIVSVYVSTYILLPAFLKKKRYLIFALTFFSLGLFCLLGNYFFSQLFYSISGQSSVSFERLFGLAFMNADHAIVIGGLSLGLKSAKNWYVQKSRNLELSKRKIKNELQLAKQRIQPDFLLASLGNLEKMIESGSTQSSDMLLKLSEILGYILYESDESLVSMERELVILRNTIEIEQLNQENQVPICCDIVGSGENQKILSLLFFSILQVCFQSVKKPESGVLQVKIRITIMEKKLRFELIIEHRIGTDVLDDEAMINMRVIKQRMSSYYSSAHLFKISREGSRTSLIIEVDLSTQIGKERAYDSADQILSWA